MHRALAHGARGVLSGACGLGEDACKWPFWLSLFGRQSWATLLAVSTREGRERSHEMSASSTSTIAPNAPDGFPLAMSPTAWARECSAGDAYAYAARGMTPILYGELCAVAELCLARGIAVLANETGLHARPLSGRAVRCTDDGFPLHLSPSDWARRCRHGDTYSLPARGKPPLSDCEMQAVIDTCARRGLEVMGGDDGMYAQRFAPRFEPPFATAREGGK